jgi:hypothetical protein
METKEDKFNYSHYLPLVWRFTDLDQSFNWYLVMLIRFVQAMTITSTMWCADEYW